VIAHKKNGFVKWHPVQVGIKNPPVINPECERWKYKLKKPVKHGIPVDY
jgi:hypothetical protein